MFHSFAELNCTHSSVVLLTTAMYMSHRPEIVVPSTLDKRSPSMERFFTLTRAPLRMTGGVARASPSQPDLDFRSASSQPRSPRHDSSAAPAMPAAPAAPAVPATARQQAAQAQQGSAASAECLGCADGSHTPVTMLVESEAYERRHRQQLHQREPHQHPQLTSIAT